MYGRIDPSTRRIWPCLAATVILGLVKALRLPQFRGHGSQKDNSMECAAVDRTDFKIACSKFPTGVTVTTLIGKDRTPRGVTLSSFTSVSLDPPLVLVCVDHRSRIYEELEVGRYLGINVLSESQQELSQQFATKWHDRFKDMPWYEGQTGVPILPGACSVLECKVVALIPAGDHSIVLAEAVNVTSCEHAPLTYVNRLYASVSSLTPTCSNGNCDRLEESTNERRG